MTCFDNIPPLVLGELVLFMDSQIMRHKKNADNSPDEYIETFFREAVAEYKRMKKMLLNLYLETNE